MNVLTAERVLLRRKTFVDADSKTRSALSFKGELSTPSPALRNQKLHLTPYQSQVNFNRYADCST